MGLTADTSTAAIAPFNFAQALFRYDGTLLTLPARHAANLLWYQSSFLRLCAAAAPKPWFQYQSSFLRLWAESCELAARSLENGFASPSTGTEQQESGTAIQNTKFFEARAQSPLEQRADGGASLSSKQVDQSIIDLLNDASAEAAGKGAARSTAAAADEPRATETNRQPANVARRSASARATKKTSKAPAKTVRRAKNKAAKSKVSRKTLKPSNRSRRRK